MSVHAANISLEENGPLSSVTPGDAGFIPMTPIPFEDGVDACISPQLYLRFFNRMRRNPLRTWSASSFRTPVSNFRFLGRHIVVLNEPGAIQHCYVTNAKNYRLNYLRNALLTPVTRSGVISVEGADWQRMRRLLTPVFNARRVSALAKPMARVAKEGAEKFAARAAGGSWERVGVAEEMTRLTLDILLATLFSDDPALDRETFSQKTTEMLERGGVPHPFDLLRAPAFVPRVGRGGVLRLVDEVRSQVHALVDSRRRAIASGRHEDVGEDLLTLLITAGDEDGDRLSNDEVVDNILTILLAGHETTARALAWTLYLLSKDLVVRRRVEAEIDSVDLDTTEPAQWENVLPFTNAVLKESMRLFPPAPQMAREAIGEDEIPCKDGIVKVAESSEVHLSPWLLHRHETLWDQPSVFRPDRFMGAEGAAIHRFAYLPFGLGPRVCIGARFAQQEMVIALASLLRVVRFEDIGEDAPEPIMRVTLQPSTPLAMAVRAR